MRSGSGALSTRGTNLPSPFYLVCLRPFGAPSGRAYPQYRLCDLFMIMKHSCDDISYHEGKITSIFHRFR